MPDLFWNQMKRDVTHFSTTKTMWGGGKKRKFRIVMKLVSAKADLTIVTSVLSTLRRVPAEDWPSLSQFIFKTVHLHRLSFLSKQLKASWGFQ